MTGEQLYARYVTIADNWNVAMVAWENLDDYEHEIWDELAKSLVKDQA